MRSMCTLVNSTPIDWNPFAESICHPRARAMTYNSSVHNEWHSTLLRHDTLLGVTTASVCVSWCRFVNAHRSCEVGGLGLGERFVERNGAQSFAHHSANYIPDRSLRAKLRRETC